MNPLISSTSRADVVGSGRYIGMREFGFDGCRMLDIALVLPYTLYVKNLADLAWVIEQ